MAWWSRRGATLPVTGLGNASASCWSITLEQPARRIIEFVWRARTAWTERSQCWLTRASVISVTAFVCMGRTTLVLTLSVEAAEIFTLVP